LELLLLHHDVIVDTIVQCVWRHLRCGDAVDPQRMDGLAALGLASVINALDEFREGKSRMVQRQQQKVGEPSEREALLTILLNMPARECLVVISLWGAKELVVLFYQL
jgi:hypothetical protein